MIPFPSPRRWVYAVQANKTLCQLDDDAVTLNFHLVPEKTSAPGSERHGDRPVRRGVELRYRGEHAIGVGKSIPILPGLTAQRCFYFYGWLPEGITSTTILV